MDTTNDQVTNNVQIVEVESESDVTLVYSVRSLGQDIGSIRELFKQSTSDSMRTHWAFMALVLSDQVESMILLALQQRVDDGLAMHIDPFALLSLRMRVREAREIALIWRDMDIVHVPTWRESCAEKGLPVERVQLILQKINEWPLDQYFEATNIELQSSDVRGDITNERKYSKNRYSRQQYRKKRATKREHDRVMDLAKEFVESKAKQKAIDAVRTKQRQDGSVVAPRGKWSEATIARKKKIKEDHEKRVRLATGGFTSIDVLEYNKKINGALKKPVKVAAQKRPQTKYTEEIWKSANLPMWGDADPIIVPPDVVEAAFQSENTSDMYEETLRDLSRLSVKEQEVEFQGGIVRDSFHVMKTVFDYDMSRLTNAVSNHDKEFASKALHAVEKLCLFFDCLMSASTPDERIKITLLFISAQAEKSIIESVYTFGVDLIQSAFGGSLELQAGPIGGVKGVWESFANSETVTRIVDVISYCVAIVLSKVFGYDMSKFDVRKYVTMNSEVKKGPVVNTLIDNILFFLDKAWMCVTTKSLSPLIMDTTSSHTYDCEYAFLKGNYHNVETYEMEKACGITMMSYMMRLETCIEETKRFAKIVPGLMEKRCLTERLSQLIKMADNTKKVLAGRSSRIKPYSIMLAGLSGVGKTTMKVLIERLVMTANPRYFSGKADSICTMNGDDQYQSELHNGHEAIVLDDLGNSMPLHSKSNPCQAVLNISNNEPKTALKADVDSKGKVYINAHMFLVTTNVEHLHAHTLSAEPAAILRRFEAVIRIRVKAAYRQENGASIDTNKVDGFYNDIWEIDVVRYTPTIAGGVTDDIVVWHTDDGDVKMENQDFATLARFLASTSRVHFGKQDALLQGQGHVFDAQICPHDNLVPMCAQCRVGVDPQGGLIPFVVGSAGVIEAAPIIYELGREMFVCCGVSLVLYLCQQISWYSHVVMCVLLCAWQVYRFTVIHEARKKSTLLRVTDCLIAAQKAHSGFGRMTAIVGLITSALLLWKRLRASTVEVSTQGAAFGSFKPDQEEEAIKSCWVVPPRERYEVDKKVQTMTKDQLAGIVRKRLAYAEFGGNESCNLFPLCSNMWIVNWHVLQKKPDRVKVFVDGERTVGPNFDCALFPNMYRRIGETDLAVLYLPKGGTQKNLLHLFPVGSVPKDTSAVLIHKYKDGSCLEERLRATWEVCHMTQKSHNFSTTGTIYKYSVSGETFPGMCMSTLIAEGKFPHIIGFHFAGAIDNSRTGHAQYITRGEIEKCMTALEADDDSPVLAAISAGIPKLDFPKYGVFQSDKVHAKSAVNFLEKGSLRVYGDHTGHLASHRSGVKNTIICDIVAEVCDHPVEFGPPKNMGNWKPKYAELEKIANTKEIPFDALEWAMKDFHTKIRQNVNVDDLRGKVFKVDNHTNLAGNDGVRGIDSIHWATSMGFPINKSKSGFVRDFEGEVPGITRPREVDQCYWDEVTEMEQAFIRGERVYPITKAHLKDEPKKLDSEKVRVMYGTPFAFLLLMRRYLLSFTKFYADNPGLFESTVGINVYSAEWDEIAHKLTQKAKEHLIAGDFAGYDSCMAALAILAAGKGIIMLLRMSGNYEEDDLMVLRGIFTELAYPMLDSFGTYLELFGSNTSGHSITIVLNDWVHKLYKRAAFYGVHDGQPPGPFHEYVLLYTNGDDSVASVLKPCKFSHTSEQDFFAKCGIQYTMADKTGESVPYLPLEKVDYLKRAFRWSVRKERYMPALKKESIFKMLQVCIPSECESPEELAATNINNALREMYYHGKRDFDKFHEQMQVVAQRAGLASWFPNGVISSFEDCEAFADEQFSRGGQIPGGLSKLSLQSGWLAETSEPRRTISKTGVSGYGYRVKYGLPPCDTSGLPGMWSLPRQAPLFRGVFQHNNSMPGYGVNLLRDQKEQEIATTNSMNSSSATNKVSMATGTLSQSTTVFRDGVDEWMTSIPSVVDATRDIGMSDDVPLSDFFSRPILIASPTWDPASVTKYYATLDPWTAYFENKRVINRINNYQLLRAKLCVKIMINGNSFYYGRMLVDYAPRRDLDQVNVYTTGTTLNTLMSASQRLHLFLDPTESQGGQMCLPMIVDVNNMDVSTSNWQSQGTLYFREMSKLKHANGSVNPISILVYAWAEDVKLSVPTKTNSSGLVPQSGEINLNEEMKKKDYDKPPAKTPVNAEDIQRDTALKMKEEADMAFEAAYLSRRRLTLEVSDTEGSSEEVQFQAGEYTSGGAISKMMSSLASAAGRLVSAPMIGPYAKATQGIAGAAGGVASLFGYSRPAQIENNALMRRFLWGPMTNTDRGDTTTKLTVDSKQELTIDPRTVGIEPADELSITAIAGRESWFAQFPWTTAVTTNQLLFTTWVTPMIINYVAPYYFTTASAFAAIPFFWWHGTMIYRFNIVASAFHRGRLLFAYTPGQQVGSPESQTQYTRIVDLSNERDFTMEVGWAQDRSFLKVGSVTTTPCWSTTALGSPGELCNGTLSVYVLNDLTTPSDAVNNDITINVFARCGDDFKVAVPVDRFKTFTYLNTVAPQSGLILQSGEQESSSETNAPVADQVQECVAKCIDTDHTMDVYFGEAIPSMRTMLKRYMHHTSIQYLATASNAAYVIDFDFPVYRGFDSEGRHTTSTTPANIVNTTLINYLAPAYIGYRGGIRCKYVVESNGSNTGFATIAREQGFTGFNSGLQSIDTTTPAKYASTMLGFPSLYTGGEYTDLAISPVLEVELPYYNNRRMTFTRQIKAMSTTAYNKLVNIMCIRASATCNVHKYVSVGEDFNFFLFQGQPPFQIVSSFVAV